MKNQKLFIIILSFLMSICIIELTALSAAPVSYDWGTPFINIKKALPSDKETMQFSPYDKPKYKNKILEYIKGIHEKFLAKTIILRVKSKPEIDYVFINKKLYTIMENWGKINAQTEKDIQYRLTNRFGKPHVQKDNNFYIYSYNNDKTKVLFYLLKQPGGQAKCKVYYYTKKLFRMLLTE